MTSTYIIGTGYLSYNLKKKINRSKIYNARDFIKNIHLINKNKKINLIINSFYTTKKLNEIISYEALVNKSIYEISKILDLLNPKIINKIIYTSSSSVYGLIRNKIKLKEHHNRGSYAALKLASESIIKNFCIDKKIKLCICRVFNMYGKNDTFSILNKLYAVKRNNSKILIYNNGKSIRDFIHIDDIITIYSSILKKPNIFEIYDIGTGKGLSVMEIVNKLEINKNNIILKKKTIDEIPISIANNQDITKKIFKKKFKNVEDYFNIKKKFAYTISNNENLIKIDKFKKNNHS